jgi:hypothetical protein
MKGMENLVSRLLELKFLQHKHNAYNKGKEWTLNYLEYVKLWGKGICAYSGVAMTFQANCPNTMSIERIDSMKGYVEGNVTFVCWPLNRSKGWTPLPQYRKDCVAVAKFQNNSKNILTRI